jgi:glycosyltransferase involved in cell wall biosynthesis
VVADHMHAWYQNADLFVFASSCENMPIILMESMVSGLPIASSNFGPMPEVLGSNGVYFNPEDSESISKSIQILIDSKELRTKMARDSYASVQTYSWQKCANDTFQFFQNIIQKKGEQKENV